LPSLIAALKGWLSRHRGASITLTIDGDTIAIEHASSEERRRLLEAFERRHVEAAQQ
jgi:hypothetical protein